MDITYLKGTITVQAKQSLTQNDFGKAIGQLLNVVFSDKGKWTEFHNSRKRKGYTFSTLQNDKISNGYFQVDTGDIAYFYLFSHNVDLMNLMEERLFESDDFKVLDIVIDNVVWKGPVNKIQVKNPLLLKDDSSGERVVYFLRPTDSEEKKQDFLDYLNRFIISDFEYITGETLPKDFKYLLDIEKPRIGHYNENGKKLIGTKGIFQVDSTILGKLVTQHIIAYGLGIKSSYLGAGSIILKGA